MLQLETKHYYKSERGSYEFIFSLKTVTFLFEKRENIQINFHVGYQL